MVKIYTNQNGQLFKVTCLSTDDKPIGVVPANTICEELDTGDKYFYDPVSSQWFPYPGGSGSGLPDPTGLPDGTALIKVGNEWKMQEGYGYTGDPAFNITWDGDTEGREVILDGHYCRVGNFVSVDELVGAVFSYTEGVTPTYTIQQSDIQEISEIGAYEINTFGNVIILIELTETTEIGSSGIYFPTDVSASVTSFALTAPSTVHKFDPELIPTSGGGMVVNFSSEDGEVWTCDKTHDEVANALNAGTHVSAVYSTEGISMGLPVCLGQLDNAISFIAAEPGETEMDCLCFQLLSSGDVNFLQFHIAITIPT